MGQNMRVPGWKERSMVMVNRNGAMGLGIKGIIIKVTDMERAIMIGLKVKYT